MNLNPRAILAKVTPASWQLSAFEKKEKLRMMKLAAAIRSRDENLQYAAKFYAAAHPGINRPMAPMISTPEDYRQAYERIIMLRYARQMEDDVPYIESILGDFETYVVGDLRYRPNTGNKEADKVIMEHLEWRFAECDYAGKLDLTGIAKLSVRSKKRDGECGQIPVDTGDALKLSSVSADRIGNPLLSSSGAENNFNGIIVDPVSGAPIKYDIWRRLPKVNAYVFDRQIDANQMIHFADYFRFEQYHGVSAFKNAISRSVDIEQIVQFAIQNIKFRSSQLPAIQNEQGKPKAPGSGYIAQPANSQGVPQPFQLEVDGVMQSFLKLGEGFVEYPHDFPNANFLEIKDDLKGDISIGVHLPGEFCFRSEAGGVLQRFYIEKAQRTFDEEKRLLRRQLLDPYKNRVLRYDVDAGWLDLSKFPGLADSRALYAGTWHMGRSVSTDYGHDTDADIKQIDANLMSPAEHAADNARDLDEILQTKTELAEKVLVAAQTLATKLNLPFETVLPHIQKQFPNPQVMTNITDNVDAPNAATKSGKSALAQV